MEAPFVWEVLKVGIEVNECMESEIIIMCVVEVDLRLSFN